MRVLDLFILPAGPRAGRGGLAVLATGLVLGLNVLVTVVRHELMHIIGGVATGGMITRVEWLPQAWTIGIVEVSPPLIANPAAFYVPLLSPYLVDVLLIALGLWCCARLNFGPIIKCLVVQHAVAFAALDILLNAAAAQLGFNDWNLILSGSGLWFHPILGLVCVASLAALAAGWRVSTEMDRATESIPWRASLNER
jgi:hypothetical protein